MISYRSSIQRKVDDKWTTPVIKEKEYEYVELDDSPVKKHAWKYWTKEEEEILRQMVDNKKNYQEICLKLHRSIDAVQTKKTDLGLVKKTNGAPWTAEEDDLLLKRISEGLTPAEIHSSDLPHRKASSIRGRYFRLKERRAA